ncbi:MAG: hypothetical protein K0S11_359 [Gammaproteobacteria bacterium]|nr:hypothetical protein [Gammaproteobacteria bacterium]
MVGGLLTGCAHIYGEHGFIKKRNDNQYLQSRCEAALQIPVDLDNKAMQDYYPIAKVKETAKLEPVSIVPPGNDFSKRLPNPKNEKRSLFTKIKDWF